MPLRLGSRGSPLALAQARLVREALLAAHGWAADAVEIVVITTTGDRVQDRPLAEIGGKALWTKELDRALLAGAIDAAVHSMKDVETIRPAAIACPAMLPRADVRDRLVGAPSLTALRQGATVGTSSPRRAAQLRAHRPQLRIVALRGNVDTRLAKLAAGEVDATLLAAAGLDRLGRDEVGVPLPAEDFLPAPAQGAVGIEARADDARTMGLLAAIDHEETHRCVAVERAFLAALSADCHSPMGALATVEGGRLRLRAQLLTEDGAATIADEAYASAWHATFATDLARGMLDRADPAIQRLFGG